MSLSSFTNIIVINAGSVTNSKDKNWATQNSIHSEAINDADKFLYEKATEYYSLTIDGEHTKWSTYENITGNEKGGNIDKCVMTLKEGKNGDEYKQTVINKLKELKTLFDSTPPPPGGGKRRRKTMRKKRNKTNKSNNGKKRNRSNKRKPKSMKV